MKKILSNRKAEGYIDITVGIIALMMVLVVTLNIYTFFMLRQDLDTVSGFLIETATSEGSFGEVFDERCEELRSSFFEFDVVASADEYYNSTYERVQLGDKMTVTVSVHTYVRGVGALKIPVTVSTTRSGISEKYWK